MNGHFYNSQFMWHVNFTVTQIEEQFTITNDLENLRAQPDYQKLNMISKMGEFTQWNHSTD